MAEFLIALLVSTLLGALAGVGVGGGSLLVLWLTLFAGFPPEQARTINLLFFLPCALAASFFRRKQGSLDLKRLLPAMAAGAAAAAVFSWLGTRLDTGLLKTLFGILLLFTGARELLYKGKKR